MVQRRRGRAAKFTVEQVQDAYARGLTIEATMEEMGCCRGTVARLRRIAGIEGRANSVNRRQDSTAGGKVRRAGVRSRHPSHAVHRRFPGPPINHPALSEGRTTYPGTVVPVEGLTNLLVKGENSWKIGGLVTKGKWRGFPIYTLTLEERATCPTYCALWVGCYGNQMHMAKRVSNGPSFEDRLEHELAVLQYRHPAGFAVRLHVLGDFYSVAYVDLWRSFLDRFPALVVFGFTARYRDAIGFALIDLIRERWDRFAVRLSNAPADTHSTATIEHPVQKPDDAIQCPQQTGRTENCGTCGLCWHTTRRIAFLRH